MTDDFKKIARRLEEFAVERDWNKFHSPKNLIMALNVEAAELMEHFQWLTEDQSLNPDSETRNQIIEELADVLIYLIRLADKLDVDLIGETWKKIDANARKYPADKVRGSSMKYSQYPADKKVNS